MNKEIWRKAEAWDILYRDYTNAYKVDKAFMDELLESLEPTYYSWEWALAKLNEGKRVSWKNWGDSYIVLQKGSDFLKRFSRVHGKLMDMGVYGISDKQKFNEAGWLLYVEEDED
jgi:hypothetical protein